MSDLTTVTNDAQIEHLISELDSLMDGELAAAKLVAHGACAIPYLERFLLRGPARTVALPRCRAVCALGELGACDALVSYLREYKPPCDPEVLFAEDAVRSIVGQVLFRWRSEEVFEALLTATKQRATRGLILALGEFRRPETVPLLFAALEDDFCREDAKDALRKVSREASHYAILSVRGLTNAALTGPAALRRRRATLQLLAEFGISPDEWPDIRGFLDKNDADVVLAVANIGFRVAPATDRSYLVDALFRVSPYLNWVQENDALRLLDEHPDLASPAARSVLAERRARGEHPDWLKPTWRVLRHVLGAEMEAGQHDPP